MLGRFQVLSLLLLRPLWCGCWCIWCCPRGLLGGLHLFSFFFLYPALQQWFTPFSPPGRLPVLLPHLFCCWFLPVYYSCLFALSSSRYLVNISCIFSTVFLRSWIIFIIITLNSFSGRLLSSTWFGCFSAVLSCPFLGHMAFCFLSWLTVCNGVFVSAAGLWFLLLLSALWWMRREASVSFLMGGTGSVKTWMALAGRTLLSKAFTGVSTDGRGCAPSLLVVRPEATPPCGPRLDVGPLTPSKGGIRGCCAGVLPSGAAWPARLRSRPSSSSRQFRFSLLRSLCSLPPVSGWDLRPSFPVEVLNRALLAFTARPPGSPRPVVGSPAREPYVRFRTFTTVGGFLWYYCSRSPTWWVILIFIRIAPLLPLAVASFLTRGICFWWIPVSFCRWLFNSQLRLWCSHRRRWAHILLLCHLELKECKFQMQTLNVIFTGTSLSFSVHGSVWPGVT